MCSSIGSLSFCCLVCQINRPRISFGSSGLKLGRLSSTKVAPIVFIEAAKAETLLLRVFRANAIFARVSSGR